MKMFLLKLLPFSIVLAFSFGLSAATGADPAWYLLALWLWQDLSETLDKED